MSVCKKKDAQLCIHCGLHPKNPASSSNGCSHEYPTMTQKFGTLGEVEARSDELRDDLLALVLKYRLAGVVVIPMTPGGFTMVSLVDDSISRERVVWAITKSAKNYLATPRHMELIPNDGDAE